jgi:hypothetical protein
MAEKKSDPCSKCNATFKNPAKEEQIHQIKHPFVKCSQAIP